jgi:hypothetical protein
MQGVTWNLSSGGMQVEIDNLQPGKAVKLCFRLPRSGITIDAAGVGVWTKQQRQGIQPTKTSAQNQQAIQEFIAEVERLD